MMDINDITLDDIDSFILNGDANNAPPEVVWHLEMMEKIRGMYLRKRDYGTKNIIVKHLMKYDKLSYYQANKLYNMTLEYFYCSTEITKEAWSNIYAEKLDNLAALAEELIENPRDAKAVAEIYHKARLARKLDEPDIPDLPKELFEKPFKLYAMDSEFLGLAPINRLELAQIIDDLPDMTEREKDKIKADAAIKPITLFENEQEDVRKQ